MKIAMSLHSNLAFRYLQSLAHRMKRISTSEIQHKNGRYIYDENIMRNHKNPYKEEEISAANTFLENGTIVVTMWR